jgi:hypothetical protein
MKTILFLILSAFLSHDLNDIHSKYNAKFVDILVDQPYQGENFDYIIMKRDSQRVKAKYFAENISSIESKYKLFAASKSVICYAAAGYLGDGYQTVENITIESGRIIERRINRTSCDALVIIQATGGVVVSNLKKADLKLSGGGADPNKALDLRNNVWDQEVFFDWAKKESATVFQTHLLAQNNELIIPADADAKSKKVSNAVRRFLVVGKNSSGKIVHIIINSRKVSGLRYAAEKCFNFSKNLLGLNIVFMINLDTGAQNVFKAYNADGTENNTMLNDGALINLSKAHNLMVYYYE